MRMVVARTGEIAPGRTKKFVFQCGAEEVEGFVLNHEGRLHAYVNRCRHVAMGLDWVENQFFTEDGCYVQCATHGAYYLPDTGECIAGPPCGKSLFRIPLTIEGDEVVAEPPSVVTD